MANIRSTKEAYEQIAEALNYLEESPEDLDETSVMGASHRVVYDEDIDKWFVEDVNSIVSEA